MSISVSEMTQEGFLIKEDLQIEEGLEDPNPDTVQPRPVSKERRGLQPPKRWGQLCKCSGQPTWSPGVSLV